METYTPPPFGVYTPGVTFFHKDETIDYDSNSQHIRRLLNSGVTGLVVHGSNGEATHLTHEERFEVIRHTRTTIIEQKSQAVIIAGCSANSVKETLMYIEEAHLAGAQYALVLPPNYWAAAMTKDVIFSFYTKVAAESVLPILIYNFPGVTAGIDIDSDMIIKLAETCPQIVGVKLTCGNLGKLQRVSSAFDPSRLAVFAGKADFLLPGLVTGSNGVISALANVVPALHVQLLKCYENGQMPDAQRLQCKLAFADAELQKFGISGVKAAVSQNFGYGSALPRAPLPTVDGNAIQGQGCETLQAVISLEKQLNANAGGMRTVRL